jgi:CelD/BcsL family acetyltransferase involved in cellulose biosynthesis
MPRFSISIIQDEDDLIELENVWNNLLFKMNNVNPFLTWEWCSTWWKYFHGNHELYTIIVKEDSEIVAIYPLRKTRYRTKFGIGYDAIEFLCYRSNGKSYTDYNGFISYKKELTCFKLFLDYFNEEKKWDIIRLHNVPEYFYLDKMISNTDIYKTIEIKNGSNCPYIENNISLEERMNQMNKKFRNNIKRRMRNIKKNFNKIEVSNYNYFHSIGDAMEILFQLHQDRWNAVGEVGVFQDSSTKSFHREIAQKFAVNNWLHLYFLIVDEIPISVEYGFIIKNKLYEYLSGFNKLYSNYSPGTLLQWSILEKYENDRDLIEIDLLRGDESYKYLWTSKERVNINSIIVNNKWSSELIYDLIKLKQRISK